MSVNEISSPTAPPYAQVCRVMMLVAARSAGVGLGSGQPAARLRSAGEERIYIVRVGLIIGSCRMDAAKWVWHSAHVLANLTAISARGVPLAGLRWPSKALRAFVYAAYTRT